MRPEILDATVVTMENKINTINHIKVVSKEKPYIGRIPANLRNLAKGHEK